MRVLTWNLFHGRSLPPAGAQLERDFSALLASWSWDVALLQEVPPWWPARLARDARAEWRRALTSRNSLLPLRRGLAKRWPDAIKSNGGGCNAVLSRVGIAEHRAVRLRVRPERRVAQLVRVADGTALANYHGSTRVPLAEQELARLWALASSFAAASPLVLGGDLNLRAPRAPAGAVHLGARDVDHVFALGLEASSPALRLERVVTVDRRPVELSDHPPLLVQARAC